LVVVVALPGEEAQGLHQRVDLEGVEDLIVETQQVQPEPPDKGIRAGILRVQAEIILAVAVEALAR